MKLKLDALGCGCWEKNGYSLPKIRYRRNARKD